jgi:DNA-binding response OmpR family regulator
MNVVALVSDLVMRSHVAAAAERAGVPVELVTSAEALVTKASQQPPQLVILDLSHPGLEPRELVPRVRELLAEGGTSLAFGPHVHSGRLAAAAEAGSDIVISRGQFHAQIDELLARYGRER